MRARFWLAVTALGVAFALLVPSVAPLSQSMDAFASDLANGTFRPFSPAPQGGLEGLGGYSGSLGGLTGSSSGNFLPGATELPQEWAMDRDGRPGHVTIDHVFNPSLGAMKRLKAYDQVSEDGMLLEVEDGRLRVIEREAFLRYDTLFEGRFDVLLRPGEPVPIYSPHPKAIVESARVDATIEGGFRVFKDGADTYHVVADHDGVVTLNITYRADSAYYFFQPARTFSVNEYPASVRPSLPAQLVEDAQVVLARAGVRDPSDVGSTLHALNEYFRSFEEGDIPAPSEVESLYLALAVGENGCCRHRAFAYMITAQAVGIPTRVVVNEAHAFVEVMTPDRRWYQINLGGCGTYSSNNPDGHPPLFDQADDPRREANPDEGQPIVQRPSVTDITESPERIQKGERYFVNGTVLSLDGRPVQGARIDVFLNETKDTPGRLTGAGTTDANGRYSVEARVPKELPARSYQLVARATDGRDGDVRYEESWSDPPVDVFSPTRLDLTPRPAAVGIPVSIPGRLLDIDGTPVAGATVSWGTAWTTDGSEEERQTVRTDPRGRFAIEATFETTGSHILSVRFDGDEHHGGTSERVQIQVDEGAILLPADAPTLVRGETGAEAKRLSGRVALGGASAETEVRLNFDFPARVPGEPVGVITSDGGPDARRPFSFAAQTTTRADGTFSLPLVPDAATPPGVYTVVFHAPELDLTASAPVRIAIQPTFELRAPERVRRDDPYVVEARLLSDNGAPISGGLVELVLGDDAASARRLLTNSTGFARFELPGGLHEAGELPLRVQFPGDPDHVNASATSKVELVGPVSLDVPWRLGAGIALLALLAGAIVHAFGQERYARRLGQRLLAGGLLPPRRFLHLRFPDHPEGVPPVFEPGSPARLEVHATDRAGRPIGLRVRASLGASHARGRAKRAGAAKLSLPTPERAAAMRLQVRARGTARLWTRPHEQDVLVTSYREAIERTFVELRLRARLSDSATAWELVEAVAQRIPAHEVEALQRAATIFDVADYSEDAIDARDYHAFALARRNLVRALDEEGRHGA